MNQSLGISKNTLISLGTVLAVGALIIGFLINNESRLTKMESSLDSHLENPDLHHNRFQKLEEDVSLNKELLIELKGLTKKVVEMDNRVERIENHLMK